MSGSQTRLADRSGRLVRVPDRGRVALTAVVAAVVTAVLAWRYAGDTDAGRTDRRVTALLDAQQGAARGVAQGFAAIGGPLPVAVALLVLAPLAWRLRGGRGLALVLLGPPTAMVTTSLVLKPIVERTRGGELAFPSGHTTSVASLAVACGVLVLGLTVLPRALRLLAVAGLAGLVVAVGAGLIADEVHYPTDTLGAIGVALAVVLGVALAVDAFADMITDSGVTDPGPDPRVFDPREHPTEVLPRS
ncbi:phosphatase PAP2 family protein [Actinomycetospora aeridis]|uniref:Phosphatase PAP2 family protein n=1 Tax=Actinomycetospora aeridis TaxID=3129231 RepID=A0ABU8N6S7_9PSEU